MLEVSDRLKTIASCVRKGGVAADIGTDHAYLPIWMIQNKIARRVIATDINNGPLSRARTNICLEGVSEYVELRLSDGLDNLARGEADTIIISGMGGRLIERILANGMDRLMEDTRLVMSPQSELMHFRVFLCENGFITDNELMLKEDGKYYVIISCRAGGPAVQSDSNAGEDKVSEASHMWDNTPEYAGFLYGKTLIERKDAVLMEYLHSELSAYEALKEKLSESIEHTCSASASERLKQLEARLAAIRYALGER